VHVTHASSYASFLRSLFFSFVKELVHGFRAREISASTSVDQGGVALWGAAENFSDKTGKKFL
jgi:hypothetical protein